MSKTALGILSALAMLAANSGSLSAAEEPPASAAELTLHVGDTITWTPEAGSQHRLRFGGTVTLDGGATLELTKFTDVQKVLDNFNPAPPSADPDGVVSWPAATPVTAKVKADTGTPAVTEFFFTCGFGPHTGRMVTVPFKIVPAVSGQPARNVQIVSVHGAPSPSNPLRWILQTKPGDSTGDRSLRRP